MCAVWCAIWWLIFRVEPCALAATLPHVFVTNKAAAVPARTIAGFDQRHRLAVFAGMPGREHIVSCALVGALKHILLGQFARQLKGNAGGLRKLSEWPAAHAIFVLVVQNAHEVDPGAARCRRTPAQLRIISVVTWIELK